MEIRQFCWCDACAQLLMQLLLFRFFTQYIISNIFSIFCKTKNYEDFKLESFEFQYYLEQNFEWVIVKDIVASLQFTQPILDQKVQNMHCKISPSFFFTPPDCQIMDFNSEYLALTVFKLLFGLEDLDVLCLVLHVAILKK